MADISIDPPAVNDLGFDPNALRKKYDLERDRRVRSRRQRTVRRDHRPFRPLPRRPVRRSRLHAGAGRARGRGTGGGRRLRRPAGGRAAARAGVDDLCIIEKAAATSAAPGTGTAIPARPATPKATSTCRCSRRPATCRKASTRAHPRSSSTRGASAAFPPVPVGAVPDGDHRHALARGRAPAGWSPPIVARCVARALRRAGRRAVEPAQAAGHSGRGQLQGPHLPHQPLGLRLHRRRLEGGSPAWPTSASASSAPAPPPCNACRTWARARRSCSCSSARRHRWTCATIAPPIPTGSSRLQPGWQRERMDNFTTVISGGRFEVDLVNDGWTDLITNILLAARARLPGRRRGGREHRRLVQLADYQKMERVRARVDAVVKDRATAEALKPWYNQFCKRPCFHDQYLPTFNRPNVHLIDTVRQGGGAHHRARRGGGRQRIRTRLPDLRHRASRWAPISPAAGLRGARPQRPDADGQVEGRRVSTFHGLFTRGFPNCS
jgi:hypothetical protein